MSNPITVRAEGLGKRYLLGERMPYKTLRESLRNAASAVFNLRDASKPTVDELWALRDVSFEVRRGEALAIIGRNGAGKSTLLKVLSRITEPTTGRAVICGRVGSLLEVGTGFHPELSGRENIYLNGAIIGMRKAEIERKFDEIVAFAEMERFLDTPVKRYSSGMYVRLAFAVAAHLEPEILVVDEVLAVGDAAFQKRCMGKMSDVAHEGRTVLFVSHNMKAVSMLCKSALLLERGQMVFNGSAEETIQAYQRRSAETVAAASPETTYPKDVELSAQITRVRVLDNRGELSLRHNLVDPMDVIVDFEVRRDFPTLLVCAEVRSSDGTLVYVTQQSDWDNYCGSEESDQFPRSAGEYRATIHLPAPLLNAGYYELELYITTGPVRIDTRKDIAFEIHDHQSFVSCVSKSPRGGVVVPPVQWEVHPVSDEEHVQRGESAKVRASDEKVE